MAHRQTLSALGITTARDLCVLDPNPPPLNFAEDLKLPAHEVPKISFNAPVADTTYWQSSGYTGGLSP